MDFYPSWLVSGRDWYLPFVTLSLICLIVVFSSGCPYGPGLCRWTVLNSPGFWEGWGHGIVEVTPGSCRNPLKGNREVSREVPRERVCLCGKWRPLRSAKSVHGCTHVEHGAIESVFSMSTPVAVFFPVLSSHSVPERWVRAVSPMPGEAAIYRVMPHA